MHNKEYRLSTITFCCFKININFTFLSWCDTSRVTRATHRRNLVLVMPKNFHRL